MNKAAIHLFIDFISKWLIENRSYDSNELKTLDLGVVSDRGKFHLGHLGEKILIGKLKEEDQKTITLLGETLATQKITDDIKDQKFFHLIGKALGSDKTTEKAKRLIASIFMNGKSTDKKTFLLLHDELVNGKTIDDINQIKTKNEDSKKDKTRNNESLVPIIKTKKQTASHELSKSNILEETHKRSKKQSTSNGKRPRKKKSKRGKKAKSNTKDRDKLKFKKKSKRKKVIKKAGEKSIKILNNAVSAMNLDNKSQENNNIEEDDPIVDLGKVLLKGTLTEEDKDTLQIFGKAIVNGKVFNEKHKETFKLVGEAIVSETITEEAKKLLGEVLVNGKNTNEETFELLRNALKKDDAQDEDKLINKSSNFEEQNINTSDGSNIKLKNTNFGHPIPQTVVTKPKLIEHEGTAYLSFPELTSVNHENDELYPKEYERPRAFYPAYVQYNPKQFLFRNQFDYNQQNTDFDAKPEEKKFTDIGIKTRNSGILDVTINLKFLKLNTL